jgi:hypothetical protein
MNVYFSRYVKSMFVLYEVISEIRAVSGMIATIAFINICYLFILL